jgi:hypothetical protein
MRVVVVVDIFSGSIEVYATISGVCRSKSCSDSSFRKRCKETSSFVYNNYRIEIREVK